MAGNLKVGQKLHAKYTDGNFYPALVEAVSESKNRAKRPVKVKFVGFEGSSWTAIADLKSRKLPKAVPEKREDAVKKSKDGSTKRTTSLADQLSRFERAKKEDNRRYLDIASVFDGSYLNGKNVLVVGASEGLGLEIVKELVAQKAKCTVTCRKSTVDLDAAGTKKVITGVEVADSASMREMASEIDGPIDYVIFNAGYFPDVNDTLDNFEEKEALKQIDICALGPIRCLAALKATDCLKGAKVAIITSQAGSAAWRFTQNRGKGGSYGHYMSRAACSIGAVLMSEELKAIEVPVVMLHPGFNRTEMTSRCSHQSSKLDVPFTSIPLNADGVVVMRLTRMARSPQLRELLKATPALQPCRQRVADAGCSLEPSFAGGALAFVPLSHEQVTEFGLELSYDNVIALSSDVDRIKAVLKEFNCEGKKGSTLACSDVIWNKEGAVESHEGAKRVLHEVKEISMKTSGRFINCEDGLRIPF